MSRTLDRLGSRWLDLLVFGLLVLFVVMTLGQFLIGQRTYLDVDILTLFQPWESIDGGHTIGQNLCRADTIDAVMPPISNIKRALLSGHFPSWSPYEVGGSPLAGLPNWGQFSPLALPFYVLPLWLAPAFIKLGEIVVSVAGMYGFLRRLDRSRAASVLAGIVFASSGFMVAWTNWPQTRVAALIPALFWSVERLVQRARLGDVVIVAVVVASLLLGGFPAVAGMALYVAALYLIVRVIARHRTDWKPALARLGLASGGLVLGGGLAGAQLLPFAGQVSALNLDARAQSPSQHLSPSTLLTTVVPDANGLCIGGKIYGSTSPIELVSYVGAAAMVLVVAALVVRSRRSEKVPGSAFGYLAVAAAVVIVLGWHGGELLHLAQQLPVFSNNFIGRIRSVLGFLLAALMAFGFDRVADRLRPTSGGPSDEGGGDAGDRPGPSTDAPDAQPDRAGEPQRRLVLLGYGWRVALGVVVLAVAGRIAYDGRRDAIVGNFYMTHLRQKLDAPAALAAAAVIVIAIVVVVGRRLPRWLGILLIAVLPVLVVSQSISFMKTFSPGAAKADFYPLTPAHQFLQQNLGEQRYASEDFVLYSATGAYYQLRTVTGHEFLNPDWLNLLKAVDPNLMRSTTLSAFQPSLTPTDAAHSAILDRMGVKYWVSDDTRVVGRSVPPVTDGSTVSVAPGATAHCTLPGGALRGVQLTFRAPFNTGPVGGVLTVAVHTPTGTVTGSRFITGVANGNTVPVAVPGDGLPAGGSYPVDISVSKASKPMVLAAEQGSISCGSVQPIDDGLKVAFSAAGALVYQRTSALPRIRWASQSQVISSSAARVAALKSGVAASTVVLNAPGPAADGKDAQLQVRTDDGQTVTTDVTAAGAGYLVVADSLQQKGWTATVDGKPARLLPADDAMVAVAVPAGSHVVRLQYRIPHIALGLASTGASLIVAVVLVYWDRRRRRRSKGETRHVVSTA